MGGMEVKLKLKFNFKMIGPIKTDLFRKKIYKEGLKATRQREEVLNIFLNSSGHKSLAQIYSQVAKTNPKISFITVYRTLKLLTRLGFASQRKFGDGETRYEPTSEGNHHDHLICLECGKIIEFENPQLEALQDGIAQLHRFKTSHHRMEIYGRCEECTRKKRIGKRKS
jgi:Fur family ferric uptake transcriptional regulator